MRDESRSGFAVFLALCGAAASLTFIGGPDVTPRNDLVDITIEEDSRENVQTQIVVAVSRRRMVESGVTREQIRKIRKAYLDGVSGMLAEAIVDGLQRGLIARFFGADMGYAEHSRENVTAQTVTPTVLTGNDSAVWEFLRCGVLVEVRESTGSNVRVMKRGWLAIP